MKDYRNTETLRQLELDQVADAELVWNSSAVPFYTDTSDLEHALRARRGGISPTKARW